MELMRGVCSPRSSSRLSPRARHSSTSDAVVAVNRSDIFFHKTTTTEGRKEGGRLVGMRKKAKMKNEKRMERNDFEDEWILVDHPLMMVMMMIKRKEKMVEEERMV